jgi:hypothetical protein
MFDVDTYLKVRLACHNNRLSQRSASREFGISRKTIRKILAHPEPPGYRRTAPIKRPMLEGFTGIIDQILEDLSLRN